MVRFFFSIPKNKYIEFPIENIEIMELKINI